VTSFLCRPSKSEQGRDSLAAPADSAGECGIIFSPGLSSHIVRPKKRLRQALRLPFLAAARPPGVFSPASAILAPLSAPRPKCHGPGPVGGNAAASRLRFGAEPANRFSITAERQGRLVVDRPKEIARRCSISRQTGYLNGVRFGAIGCRRPARQYRTMTACSWHGPGVAGADQDKGLESRPRAAVGPMDSDQIFGRAKRCGLFHLRRKSRPSSGPLAVRSGIRPCWSKHRHFWARPRPMPLGIFIQRKWPMRPAKPPRFRLFRKF